MVEIINKRLDVAIDNLDNDNFIELFPIILDDLEYILVDFEKEESKLSIEEQFEMGILFNKKINIYFGRLAKLYFKLIQGIDINVINSNDYNLSSSSGGYNSNDDNIYYSDFGAMLGKKSELSFLHTCLHEGRHKMQHDAYKSNNLLTFPPYMLRLLKEKLLEKSLNDNNRKFYLDNYYLFYTENDAEIFARKEIYNIIKNFMYIYLKISNKLENDIDKELLLKINKINQLFDDILVQEKFNINNEIISQIYGSNLTNGNYVINNEQFDRMIKIDKFIKANPELQKEYPILRLLFNGNVPKSYDEIISDLNIFKKNKTPIEQQQIDNLYKEIILLDPILFLNDILVRGDMTAFDEFIKLHPTITSEYKEEIRVLNEKYGCFGNFIK